MTITPLSLNREDLERRERELFSGRKIELNILEQVYSRNGDPPNILYYFGIGGVGKSALLRNLFWQTKVRRIPSAFVSGDDHHSRISLMRGLSQQLSSTPDFAAYFRKFTNLLKEYRQLQNKAALATNSSTEKTLAQKAFLEASKGAITSTVGALLGTAIAGPGGTVLGGALGSALTPLVDAAGEAFPRGIAKLDSDDMQLLYEPEDRLATSFANGINNLVSKTGLVVLLFDAFEYLRAEERWLREHLMGLFHTKGIVVILAGREPPNKKEWSKWLDRLIVRELRPLSEQETYDYLERIRISDPVSRKEIFRRTTGLPIALDLYRWLVENSRTAIPVVITGAEEAEFRENVLDSFLRDIADPDLRRILHIAAIPRWFNNELLQILCQVEELSPSYDDLTQITSLVRFRLNGLSLHDSFREYSNEAMRTKAPLQFDKLQKMARDYFGAGKKLLESQNRTYDEEWKAFTFEWIYHCILTQDASSFLLEIQRASRYYQHEFGAQLLLDVENYRREAGSFASIFAYHKSQDFIHHNDFSTAIEILTALHIQEEIGEPKFQLHALHQLGKAYYWSGRYPEALTILNRAHEGAIASNDRRLAAKSAKYLCYTADKIGEVRQSIRWGLQTLGHLKASIRYDSETELDERDNSDRYYILAVVARCRQQWDLALRLHEHCYIYRRLLKNKYDLGESAIAIAECHYHHRATSNAVDYLNIAESVYKTTDDDYWLGYINYLRGKEYVVENETEKALSSLSIAMEQAENSQNWYCRDQTSLEIVNLSISNIGIKTTSAYQSATENLRQSKYHNIYARFLYLTAVQSWRMGNATRTSRNFAWAILAAFKFNSWLLDELVDGMINMAERESDGVYIITDTISKLAPNEALAILATESNLRQRDRNPTSTTSVGKLMNWISKPRD